ncbi:MAG: hypothetical protein Q9219_006324 [cf. Caloplaca sp. 3 TL-2023]
MTRPTFSSVKTALLNDVSNAPSSMSNHTHRSPLSAAAPEFVPRAYPPMPSIPEEETNRTVQANVPIPSKVAQPIYDNQVPSVPTHWVPIYGSGHGIFYDPLTKLFFGDGLPRPTLERPDGTIQPIDMSTPLPPFGYQQEDVLHLQPHSMAMPTVRKVENDPDAVKRYYCRCREMWMIKPHDCPIDWEDAQATTTVIRPGDPIPLISFTHDLAIGDLGYLTPQQRYAYESGVPMPMNAPWMSISRSMSGKGGKREAVN